nr:hypothetical protein [Pandoravirus belohorizontensis]
MLFLFFFKSADWRQSGPSLFVVASVGSCQRSRPLFPSFVWAYPSRQTVSVGRTIDRDERDVQSPDDIFFVLAATPHNKDTPTQNTDVGGHDDTNSAWSRKKGDGISQQQPDPRWWRRLAGREDDTREGLAKFARV